MRAFKLGRPGEGRGVLFVPGASGLSVDGGIIGRRREEERDPLLFRNGKGARERCRDERNKMKAEQKETVIITGSFCTAIYPLSHSVLPIALSRETLLLFLLDKQGV